MKFNSHLINRLNVNKKLLAFKQSKDIHGREALFDNINKTYSLFDTEEDLFINRPTKQQLDSENIETNESSSNATDGGSNKQPLGSMYVNSEVNFQIVLTTWPGLASYEISFKYNVIDELFHFNRNEISRINSYNSSANCILSKRPDLRQFCYCK